MKFLSIKDLLEGKRYNDLEKPKIKPNFRQPINTSDTNRMNAGNSDENKEIDKENLINEEPQILDNLNTTTDSPDSPDSPESNSKSKENIINENEEEKSKEDNDNVLKDSKKDLTEQDTNKQLENTKNKKDEKNDLNKIDFVKKNIRNMKLHFGKRLPKPKETLENVKENIIKERKPIKIVYRKPELLSNPFGRYSGKKKENLLLKTPRTPKVIEVQEFKEEDEIYLDEIETSSEIENERAVEILLPRKVSSRRLENLRTSINKIRRETHHISRAPLPKHKLYREVTNIFSNIDEQMQAISISGIDSRLKRRMRQKAINEAKEKRKRKQIAAFQRQKAGTNIIKNKTNKNSREKIFNQAGDWQNEISNSRNVRTLPKSNLGILRKSKKEEMRNVKTVAQQKRQPPPLKFINFKKPKKVKIQHVGQVFKSNKRSTIATTKSKKENVKNIKQFLTNKPKVSTKWNKAIPPTKYEVLTKNSTNKTLSKLRQF